MRKTLEKERKSSQEQQSFNKGFEHWNLNFSFTNELILLVEVLLKFRMISSTQNSVQSNSCQYTVFVMSSIKNCVKMYWNHDLSLCSQYSCA